MNKQYIRYQVQIRKYTSNCIEGVYLNENNKECVEYILGLGHAFGKKKGDQFTDELVSFLNDTLKQNLIIYNEQSNTSKI